MRSGTRRQQVRVEPRQDGEWAVIKEGASRALRVLSTKKAALALARVVALKTHGEIVIHDESGKIEERIIPEASSRAPSRPQYCRDRERPARKKGNRTRSTGPRAKKE